MTEKEVTRQNDHPWEGPEWQEITMTTSIGMEPNVTLTIDLGVDADEVYVFWGDRCRGRKTTHTYKKKGVYKIIVKTRNIRFLDVSESCLETLDVQQATSLIMLFCSMNNLQRLELSSLTKLKLLDCYNNKLEMLDLRQNTELLKVNCRQNELKTLRIRECHRLKDLDCSRNKLKFLSLTYNKSVMYVKCNDNCLSGPLLNRFVNGLFCRILDDRGTGHLEIRNNPGSAKVDRSWGWEYDDMEEVKKT